MVAALLPRYKCSMNSTLAMALEEPGDMISRCHQQCWYMIQAITARQINHLVATIRSMSIQRLQGIVLMSGSRWIKSIQKTMPLLCMTLRHWKIICALPDHLPSSILMTAQHPYMAIVMGLP